MAEQHVTIRIDLAGHLTHCGSLMTMVRETTTWEGEAGPKVTDVEFVCQKGCGATATLSTREPA